MPRLSEAKGGLHYEVIDFVAPWHKNPETIIFHHGAGSISGMWAEWIGVLGDKYRIVTFDFRGMGKSANAKYDKGWSFEVSADDVVAVADAVGVDKFHFVGESYGGTVGLMLGLRHKNRVHTLTISNAAHIGSRIGNIAEWERTLRKPGGALEWSKGMMKDRFYPDQVSPELWAWYEEQQASHPIDSIIDARKTLVDADLSERLKEIDTPTLLLHGDASPFVSVALMSDMKSRMPNAELQIFAHAKHGVPVAYAKQCAGVLRAFLDRQHQRG